MIVTQANPGAITQTLDNLFANMHSYGGEVAAVYEIKYNAIVSMLGPCGLYMHRNNDGTHTVKELAE